MKIIYSTHHKTITASYCSVTLLTHMSKPIVPASKTLNESSLMHFMERYERLFMHTCVCDIPIKMCKSLCNMQCDVSMCIECTTNYVLLLLFFLSINEIETMWVQF